MLVCLSFLKRDAKGSTSHQLSRPFGLTLDQQNILERNHQVQQMGMIYKNAQQVIAWMGDEPHVASMFREMNSHGDRSTFGSFENLPTPCHRVQKSFPRVTSNGYWNRAWITQEMLLARHLYLLANEDAIDMIDINMHLEKLHPKLRPRNKIF